MSLGSRLPVRRQTALLSNTGSLDPRHQGEDDGSEKSASLHRLEQLVPALVGDQSHPAEGGVQLGL
ncbi:hypothetical protein, partial [Klebsiella pneumoniae]|uniref:hypothetical protein n=1 Tax=Klebsiella pneumoniae TaxID=573 RepID=UPI00273139DB